jgi:hypothetical protein
MPVPLAHAGHWLAGLLYLAPVVIVVGALVWQGYRDRRLEAAGGDEATAADADEPAGEDELRPSG